jgi:hypothetical protein
MDSVIEAIGEYVSSSLKQNKPLVAKGILNDVEAWYEDHIENIKSAKKLMEDSVFNSVYYFGYENVYWNDVQHTLNIYFSDEVDEALLGAEKEDEAEAESDSE